MRLVTEARATGLDLTFEIVLKYSVLSDKMAQHLDLIKSGNITERPAPDPLPFGLLDLSKDTGRLATLYNNAERQCVVASPQKVVDIVPCSSLQAGLLASYFTDPGAYLMHLVYRVPLNLNLLRLEDAWASVIRRTPCLSTRFIEHEGTFYQAVIANGNIQWHVSKHDKKLEDIVAAQKKVRVEVGERMSWFTLVPVHCPDGEDKLFLLWTLDHAIADAWLISLVTSAVEQEYSKQVLQGT